MDTLEQWLARVLDLHGSRIIPIDRMVADRWGRLDSLIAATALVHDLTPVTRNVRDMARTGVRSLDPFAEG